MQTEGNNICKLVPYVCLPQMPYIIAAEHPEARTWQARASVKQRDKISPELLGGPHRLARRVLDVRPGSVDQFDDILGQRHIVEIESQLAAVLVRPLDELEDFKP